MATTIVTTNAGLAALVAELISGTGSSLNTIGFGTGVHTAAATDTALTTQVAKIGTNAATAITTTVTNDTVQASQTYTTVAGGESITETGLFFGAAGAMLTSVTLTGADIKVLTDPGSSVTFTYKIKFA